MITLNTDYLKGAASAEELVKIFPLVRQAHESLHSGKGLGAEFTGWLDLPTRIPDSLIKEISSLAAEVHQNDKRKLIQARTIYCKYGNQGRGTIHIIQADIRTDHRICIFGALTEIGLVHGFQIL